MLPQEVVDPSSICLLRFVGETVETLRQDVAVAGRVVGRVQRSRLSKVVEVPLEGVDPKKIVKSTLSST